MMNWHKLLQDFVLLLVAVNPLLVVSEFLVTTRKLAGRRRKIALEAVLIAGGVLFAFIAVGQIVLDELKVELDAFQIATGLILLLMSLKMVLHEGSEPHLESSFGRNVAVFPLAMPFIAGPKSVMSVVLLTDNNIYSVTDQLEVAGLLAVVLAVTLVCMLAAQWVHKVLRDTGIDIITRVMGIILAALAVQYILTGLKGALQIAA
ncbi:MAG: MarC family protein [Stellaceae bacterium]|jgi:multiple antibiotic resistance protein